MRWRHHVAQSLQDLLLRLRVHRGERVVEDEDARVDGERAGERGALLLPSGERDAALAHEGVVALGEVAARPCRAGRQPRPTRRGRGSSSVRPEAARSRAIVSEKRNVSWGTKPTARRRRSRGISRTSCPSTKTVPGGGSKRRGRRLTSVVFPDPVGPTTATVAPAGTSRSMPSSTGPPVVGEGQAAERDVARAAWSSGSGVSSRISGRASSERQDPSHRGLAALEEVDHPAQRDHRPVQHGEVDAEGHELAEGDRPRAPPSARPARAPVTAPSPIRNWMPG